MAVRTKLTAVEQDAIITRVECPCCGGAGMVTPQERVRLLRVMPELQPIDLASTDLDEDGPA